MFRLWLVLGSLIVATGSHKPLTPISDTSLSVQVFFIFYSLRESSMAWNIDVLICLRLSIVSNQWLGSGSRVVTVVLVVLQWLYFTQNSNIHWNCSKHWNLNCNCFLGIGSENRKWRRASKKFSGRKVAQIFFLWDAPCKIFFPGEGPPNFFFFLDLLRGPPPRSLMVVP